MIIAPGQFKMIVSDPHIARTKARRNQEGKPVLYFTIFAGMGFTEGPRWIAIKGCRAFRNWRKKLQWSCPHYPDGRLFRPLGYVSPLVYQEVLDWIEENYGEKLVHIARRKPKRDASGGEQDSGGGIDRVIADLGRKAAEDS